MSESNFSNPLYSNDSIDKIKKNREKSASDRLKLKEEEEQYALSINRLFSSEDGLFFLNKMKRACGINLFDNELNPAKLVEDRGRASVWHKLIRDHIDVEILRKTEQ